MSMKFATWPAAELATPSTASAPATAHRIEQESLAGSSIESVYRYLPEAEVRCVPCGAQCLVFRLCFDFWAIHRPSRISHSILVCIVRIARPPQSSVSPQGSLRRLYLHEGNRTPARSGVRTRSAPVAGSRETGAKARQPIVRPQHEGYLRPCTVLLRCVGTKRGEYVWIDT